VCSFAEHCALSVCSYVDTGNEKITFSDIDSHKQTIDATHISQIDKVTLCASFTRQKAKAIRDLRRAADIISPPNEWDDTLFEHVHIESAALAKLTQNIPTLMILIGPLR
jgi:hypothetical protein